MQQNNSPIGRFRKRDDNDLVRRVLGGGREEYALLVRRHFFAVYARAYARLSARPEAASVTREAFLEVYRRLDTLAPGESFEDRLRAVTRELCKHPPAQAPADDDTDHHRRIRQAFLTLDEPSRLAVLLRYGAGRPLRIIAEQCGTSASETEARLQAAEARMGGERLKDVIAAVTPMLSVEDVARDALSEPVVWRVPEPQTPAPRKRLRLAATVLVLIAAACYFTPNLLPSDTAPEAAKPPARPLPAPAVASAPAPASAPEPAPSDKTGTIEGRVLDGLTQEPLAEFEVAHPADKDAQGKPVFVKSVDPQGRFFLGGLEPGPADVLVRAAGYANAASRVTVPDTLNEPAEVVVRLERARTIEGIVLDATGQPAADVAIFVGEIPFPFPEGREAGRSDAQGRFRAEGVPPRPVPICAYHPDYAVKAAPAPSEGPLQFVLDPASRMNGLIHAGGEPLANAEVRVEPRNTQGHAVSGYTDSEGRFSLDALPSGSLEFTVNWSDTRRVTRSVELRMGETAHMDIAFPRATTCIEGRVTQHGVLVQYAEVEAEVTAESGEVFTTLVKTGAEGWYRTDPAPPGKARLYVMAVTANSRMRRKVLETTVPGGESIRQDIDFKEAARLEAEVVGLEEGEHARIYVLWSPLERRPMTYPQLEALTRKAVARQFKRQNGPFRIDSLEPGRYTLFAVALREETPEDFARGRIAETEITVGPKDTKPARLIFE